MSDDDEDTEPAVSLGEEQAVEGAPLARVSSRLTWPKEASEIDRLEGDSLIRTPDGPRTLSDVTDEVDETYFERRQEFESHVNDVIGTGPIPTAGPSGSETTPDETDSAPSTDGAGSASTTE